MKKAKLITPNRRQRGFTMIELIVTITILAILMSIAVPSFTSTMRNNRVIAETNNLITALAVAKSEATKRGGFVSMCGSAGAACSGSTTWGSDWLVFLDVNGDGVLDPGDTVLNTFTANPQTQVSADQISITYRPTGEITVATNLAVNNTGCSSTWQRRIAVLLSGRAAVTNKQAC